MCHSTIVLYCLFIYFFNKHPSTYALEMEHIQDWKCDILITRESVVSFKELIIECIVALRALIHINALSFLFVKQL